MSGCNKIQCIGEPRARDPLHSWGFSLTTQPLLMGGVLPLVPTNLDPTVRGFLLVTKDIAPVKNKGVALKILTKVEFQWYYTVEKDKQIFLIYKEIQNG